MKKITGIIIVLFICSGMSARVDGDNSYKAVMNKYQGKFIEAMRYGNPRVMVRILKASYSEGGIPSWLLEYNRDMLLSCNPNALLFTSGTLDTVAAWYLQYVMGFRRDVTVIPVDILSKPWYIITLSERKDVIANPVDVGGMSRIDILNGVNPAFNEWPVSIPVSDSARKSFDLSKSTDAVLLDNCFKAPCLYSQSVLAWFDHIVRNNKFNRPVHLSLLCYQQMFQKRGSCFQLCGLTYQIVPPPCKEVNEKSTMSVLQDSRFIKNTEQFDFLETNEADSVIMQYAFINKELANSFSSIGNGELAQQYLNRMQMLTDSCMILNAETKAALRKTRDATFEF